MVRLDEVSGFSGGWWLWMERSLFAMCGPQCQPPPHSSITRVFFVDRAVAARNSPSQLVSQLQLSSPSCQIIVAVAENDSPEFRKQSEEYYTVSTQNPLQLLPFVRKPAALVMSVLKKFQFKAPNSQEDML